MSIGPERQRLDAALAPADEGVVEANGVSEWRDAATRLDEVILALRTAADSGLGIGGRTGPAMFEAMKKSADNLEKRVALFREGQTALQSAAETIGQIRAQRNRIDTDPATAALPDPGSFSDDPEWDDEKRMTEQGKHSAAVSAFQEREALREQRAREIAEQFDRRYDEPIAVMKKIHGVPDPEPAGGTNGSAGQGAGGRGPIAGGRGGSAGQPLLTPGGGHGHPGGAGHPVADPAGASHPDASQPGGGNPSPVVAAPLDDTVAVTPTTDPAVTGPGGGGLPGTIGTGVGLGLGGGALLGGLSKGIGLVRGPGAGALAGGQQTRPLGGVSRSAVSGTLGRGPAAGAPVSGRPAVRGGVGAAASAGRTAAGRTGGTAAAGRAGGTAAAPGAGGRSGARTGAAGGRGGAAGAGGAGRGRAKDRRTDSEVYEDDGSDWLDDEAAPGVLD